MIKLRRTIVAKTPQCGRGREIEVVSQKRIERGEALPIYIRCMWSRRKEKERKASMNLMYSCGVKG